MYIELTWNYIERLSAISTKKNLATSCALLQEEWLEQLFEL